MERKEYQCKKSRVHGVDAPLNGHKDICPCQHCACKDCEQVSSYQRQHVMDGRARTAPKEMTACDVIAIAKRTAARLRVQLRVPRSSRRGALNRSIQEVASKTPTVHPALHMRRAIRDFSSAQTTSKGAGRSRKDYTHTSTEMYKGYSSSRPDYDDRPSTSRDGASPMASTSRDDGACPSTSSVPDFALQDDVMTLTELFPGAQENLGLSALMDIRAGASNMESAGTWRHTGHPQIEAPHHLARVPCRYATIHIRDVQIQIEIQIDELMTEGVDFKHHMYVPEKDGRNLIRRREDHCHLLKRIATHLRKEPLMV
ncbi:hypothetical protein Bbelb_035080 [Branchiostoma belcheri]|nr:hypothetical protein Bbelb_035080 [Branchiostoma belcheri]